MSERREPPRFVATKVEIEGREETKIVELPAFEPEPWSADAELSIVGCPVPRMDAREKVTGRAVYTADVRRTQMLYATFIRAPVARGRVSTLDLSPALATPGVRAVLLRSDVEGIELDGVQLFDENVHYVGQPIAAVCADSLGAARQAARAAVLEIDRLPHVVTATAASAGGAPRIRPNGNMARKAPRTYSRGDVDAGLRQADVVVSREYRTPVALHTALEPHGAVAEWDGERLTVWESTQGIFMTRADLARELGLPLSHVRVLKDYMGGGFGAKNGASHATYAAAALARKVGRPVRCVLDREGEQMDAGNRPAAHLAVTLGAKRDGTLTAMFVDATIPLGIGGWQSSPAKIFHDLYACENVRTSETFVYTNAGAMGSFRAPGHVEGAFALECALDALAREIGVDPLHIRRSNYAVQDQVKRRPYSDKRLDECYTLGAERFGWDELRGTRARSGRHRRGRGMASLTWGAGGGPPAYASVRLNRDGTVEVLSGSQDLGTGARTVLAQIAAEALGARLSDVRTVLGDTERLPYTGNSWGSATTASVGPAVRVAAIDARQRLLEAAAAMLNAAPEDLHVHDSVISVPGSERSLTFAEVCERLGDVMIIGQGSRGPNPAGSTIAVFGAQFAEVEVDVETGRVRVLRIVSVHDSGRIINPRLARSQLEGGIIQGLGYALFEERMLDEQLGVPLNPNMHDYKIPTGGDIPEIDALFVTASDTEANHTGAKGVAEPPIIGVAPAIANAVADALGVEMDEIPLTPWRVLARLRGKPA